MHFYLTGRIKYIRYPPTFVYSLLFCYFMGKDISVPCRILLACFTHRFCFAFYGWVFAVWVCVCMVQSSMYEFLLMLFNVREDEVFFFFHIKGDKVMVVWVQFSGFLLDEMPWITFLILVQLVYKNVNFFGICIWRIYVEGRGKGIMVRLMRREFPVYNLIQWKF